MNNELAQLANEKGFIPENLTISWKEDYYLWVCSLQKWLREVHNILVIINPSRSEDEGKLDCFIYDLYENGEYFHSSRDYKNYEASLEAGLLNALQLIK